MCIYDTKFYLKLIRYKKCEEDFCNTTNVLFFSAIDFVNVIENMTYIITIQLGRTIARKIKYHKSNNPLCTYTFGRGQSQEPSGKILCRPFA